MNERKKKFSESKRVFISSINNFCEKRKGICGVIIGWFTGLLGWAIFYFSKKLMPFEIWRIFIILFLLVLLLLLVLILWRIKKEQKNIE